MTRRVVKFRAWDKKEGVFVDLARDGGYELWVNVLNEVQVVKNKMPLNERYILMQFVGLIDKNGKEVYEGDLVKQNFENEMGSFYEGIGVVRWCDGHLGFEVRGRGYTPESGANTLGTNSEIIGNIYENPELLK